MKDRVKKYTVIYVVLGAAIALLFAYLLLDFFVIPRAQNVEPVRIALSTPSASPEGSSGMQAYDDDSSEDTGSFYELFGTPGGLLTGQRPETGTTQDPAENETPDTSGMQAAEPAGTATPEPAEKEEPTPTPEPTVLVTDNEYHNGEVDIVITKYREYGTDIYVADVTVKDVYSLKAAFAKNTFGKNIIETTSQQAKNNRAILAINGDFYGKREKGYVVRNGEAWRTAVSGRSERNTREDLAVLQDGSFRIFSEDDTPFEEVASWGTWQVFSFGPALIKDGVTAVSSGDDVMNHLSSNPRTAIAEISPLHYLLVVSDGRTYENDGLSLLELAEFLRGLGARQAYNFDGGGSSAMYFNGKIINKPVNSGRITERFVSDIVYIPE